MCAALLTSLTLAACQAGDAWQQALVQPLHSDRALRSRIIAAHRDYTDPEAGPSPHARFVEEVKSLLPRTASGAIEALLAKARNEKEAAQKLSRALQSLGVAVHQEELGQLIPVSRNSHEQLSSMHRKLDHVASQQHAAKNIQEAEVKGLCKCPYVFVLDMVDKQALDMVDKQLERMGVTEQWSLHLVCQHEVGVAHVASSCVPIPMHLPARSLELTVPSRCCWCVLGRGGGMCWSRPTRSHCPRNRWSRQLQQSPPAYLC
jgi:hypothetical protein